MPSSHKLRNLAFQTYTGASIYPLYIHVHVHVTRLTHTHAIAKHGQRLCNLGFKIQTKTRVFNPFVYVGLVAHANNRPLLNTVTL